MQPRTDKGRHDRLKALARGNKFVATRLSHLNDVFREAESGKPVEYRGNKTALKIALGNALEKEGKAPASAEHMARALSQFAVRQCLTP